MNVTKLLVGRESGGEIVHLRHASSRVSRTPAQLSANVAALCAGFREIGLRSGDAVLILCGTRVECVETLLATFNIGATAVPTSLLLGATHLRSIIERTRPRCCVVDDPPEAAVQQALDECGTSLVAIRGPSASLPRGWIRYSDLIGRDTGPLTFGRYTDDHRALIIHGSGSSGMLKSVTMSHGELLRFFECHDRVYSQYSDGPDTLASTSPMIVGLPLSHLAGVATCLQGLMNGRRTVLMSFFLPEVYLKIVEEFRAAFIMLVPSLYRSLLNEPYLERMDKSALRFCITGGEACPEGLIRSIEAAFGAPLVSVYSMTECLSGIAHYRHDLFSRRVKPGSCGKAFFGETSLRDAHGREHPSEGELWVRNATVHECYLDPQMNADRMTDGWFKTGDLFYKDVDGEFFHRGRADDMFVCNGKNIYPLEMELMLMRHPAVELVCAAPVNSALKGTVPAVLMTMRHPVSAEEIQDFSMRNGPSHTIPQLVIFTSTIPLVGPGKLDRPRVRSLLQQACDESRS